MKIKITYTYCLYSETCLDRTLNKPKSVYIEQFCRSRTIPSFFLSLLFHKNPEEIEPKWKPKSELFCSETLWKSNVLPDLVGFRFSRFHCNEEWYDSAVKSTTLGRKYSHFNVHVHVKHTSQCIAKTANQIDHNGPVLVR